MDSERGGTPPTPVKEGRSAPPVRYGLELHDVVVTYPDGFEAIHGVSLSVDDGEIIALLGASGSGKSSLLRAIAGLERVTSGQVLMAGREVTRLPAHLRGCGMVFQDGQLFPHRNVRRNIAYGLERPRSSGAEEEADLPASGRETTRPDGQPTCEADYRAAGWLRRRRLRRCSINAEVDRLLELVGLAGYGERAVTTLSGGQAQRVALARSLAPRPAVLLLDEPLSALDRALREELSAELRRILTASGTCAVYVTHDHEEAFTVADRVALIDDGRITRVGTVAQIRGEL
ncbi:MULTISPECIES: ABC transporter ATP-binding protein [unclassified Actinobaculum]|uniref:ABC transporter ATP-binding protein n=1 Tax=unclassified Actinobaculum TaxID=2609299 RepID=UPI000D526CBD|nr:ABC transporter [Actinobaculum sp. 313]RTE48259.1 ABC transporter ATP-binding protein [Actinobaculum sp. 352]